MKIIAAYEFELNGQKTIPDDPYDVPGDLGRDLILRGLARTMPPSEAPNLTTMKEN